MSTIFIVGPFVVSAARPVSCPSLARQSVGRTGPRQGRILAASACSFTGCGLPFDSSLEFLRADHPMNVTAAPLIGQPVDRAEDWRFLTGTGEFVDDWTCELMLHAVVLRSSVAHGRIKRIDASAALARPGVRAVITA